MPFEMLTSMKCKINDNGQFRISISVIVEALPTIGGRLRFSKKRNLLHRACGAAMDAVRDAHHHEMQKE
jgi:hypothetical protein